MVLTNLETQSGWTENRNQNNSFLAYLIDETMWNISVPWMTDAMIMRIAKLSQKFDPIGLIFLGITEIGS